MPIITSIKPQKNRKRVNIYLDGKFGFGIDLENYIKLDLKVEQELTESEIRELVKKSEYAKILDKLLRFASLRPRSIKEINLWLKRKKVHHSLIKELFNRLKKLELVDDKKFALWWIEQRLLFRPKGKKALIMELRIKGIAKEIIDEVFEKSDINETKIAKLLLDKKLHLWKGVDKLSARKKMTNFLARKGISWDVIRKVVGIENDLIDQ